MAQNSKIEWTHHTANLWWGCTKVHEGCDHCYAETLSNRWNFDVWGNDKPRREIKSVFKDLVKYQKLAEQAGEMQRVFVGSMMDIFEKPMMMVDSKGVECYDGTGFVRNYLFSNIDANHYPNLMFLFLTKRPSNINKYVPESWKENPPKNVMFGTSPVNQATAAKLIPQLLQVKGKKFLSVEPQLDDIQITKYIGGTTYKCSCGFHETENELIFLGGKNYFCDTCKERCIQSEAISWVIQGGESGHHRRPFNIQWAYDMQRQCKEAGVPYFFKQIDKIKPIPEDLMIREFPKL